MVMIFSSERIEGLSGTYATATLASEADVGLATLIYTNNKRIIQMAKTLGVPVRDFPKQPPTDEKQEPTKYVLTGKGTVTSEDETEEEVFEPLVMTQVTDNTKLDATSSIEDDIKAGMSTPDLKKKYGITGTEVGAKRRELKAK